MDRCREKMGHGKAQARSKKRQENQHSDTSKHTERVFGKFTILKLQGLVFLDIKVMIQAVNDEDNQESLKILDVNQESGEVIRKETEEEPAIEDELIAAIISNAQSSAGDPATGGYDKAR